MIRHNAPSSISSSFTESSVRRTCVTPGSSADAANVARIALSERQHELASLRVLGFTRAEISSILLGELAVLTVLAVPLGLWMGYGFASVMVAFGIALLLDLMNPVIRSAAVMERDLGFAPVAVIPEAPRSKRRTALMRAFRGRRRAV